VSGGKSIDSSAFPRARAELSRLIHPINTVIVVCLAQNEGIGSTAEHETKVLLSFAWGTV